MKNVLAFLLCLMLLFPFVVAEENPTAEVTLHVYSGVKNPSWKLSQKQIEQFSAMLANVKSSTLVTPPGMLGGLGYQGFSVATKNTNKLPASVFVHMRIVHRGHLRVNLLSPDSSIENWLLNTASLAIDKGLFSYVESQLLSSDNRSMESLLQKFRAAPPYDPDKWNKDFNIRRRNNCYNYGNDIITNTFAQPGRATGKKWTALACKEVTEAAMRDGLKPVTKPFDKLKAGHYVALCVWPRRDYHWYRLDENGMWSHKPGGTSAKDTDHGGKRIKDPETCNRGPYTEFCGYFLAVPTKVKIK